MYPIDTDVSVSLHLPPSLYMAELFVYLIKFTLFVYFASGLLFIFVFFFYCLWLFRSFVIAYLFCCMSFVLLLLLLLNRQTALSVFPLHLQLYSFVASGRGINVMSMLVRGT